MVIKMNDQYAAAWNNCSLEIRDVRHPQTVLADTDSLYYPDPTEQNPMTHHHPVLVIMPGRQINHTTEYPDSISVQSESAEGWTVAATYANGHQEHWQIKVGANQITFHNESHPQSQVHFKTRAPLTQLVLQLWQTGKGEQIINKAITTARHEHKRTLQSSDEKELIFYSARPRNIARIQASQPGSVSITDVVDYPADLRNLPYQHAPYAWEANWTSSAPGAGTMIWQCGAQAAATHYHGRLPIRLPDVQTDFGDFFYQAALGFLPLNLRCYEGRFIAPRCNTLIGPIDAYMDVWSRDIMWACEFGWPLDPAAITELAAHYLDYTRLHSQQDNPRKSPVGLQLGPYCNHDQWHDDAAAEVLVMAARHLTLTGNQAFARERLSFYRQCTDYLLQLRPPDRKLPLMSRTWDGQGNPMGFEPYFTALTFYAVKKMAWLEASLGDEARSTALKTAADEMQSEALRDYQQGGLWHSARGTFINFIDTKDPKLNTPLPYQWSRSDHHLPGVVRDEYAHYQTIIPIYWGLLDDPHKIHSAFKWIDDHYNYAQGCGGTTLPPFSCQNVIMLADVYLRHQYGIGGADRLLQLITDRALDGGIPFPEQAVGGYGKQGPMELGDPEFENWTYTHSGRPWDNSPYFRIIFEQHYGLQYSHEGWRLTTPNPLAHYTLTQVNGLRHANATFDITWEGQGDLHQIWVDGKHWQKQSVDHTDGHHRIHIILQPGSC